MQPWLRRLREQLDHLKTVDLSRTLQPVQPQGRKVVVDGRELINLAGNDYLALASHPHLQQAAIRAIQQHGTGASASRLVVGHQPIHQRIEQRFAAFKHAEAALLLPTGYMANLAALTSLAGPGDLICIDKLSHASLIDAARASGAMLRVYPHRSHGKLQRLLQRHQQHHAHARRFIVTDAVFSMDGDAANLPGLCDLADAHEAVLIVDEAHGTGVLGDSGAGLCELQGVAERVPIVISTAGKALGGLGGIVTAPRIVIDTLVNHARCFIFTTAVPPAQAAVLDAALDVVRDEPQRRRRLIELTRHVRRELAQRGWLTGEQADEQIVTPIIPLIVGQAKEALRLAQHLRDHGIFAAPIRPPAVAPGASRLRIALRADLTDADINQLLQATPKARALHGDGSVTTIESVCYADSLLPNQ